MFVVYNLYIVQYILYTSFMCNTSKHGAHVIEDMKKQRLRGKLAIFTLVFVSLLL